MELHDDTEGGIQWRKIVDSAVNLSRSTDDRKYCYTSTKNTCTRLVQIGSRDVNKYTLLPDQYCRLKIIYV